MPPGKQYSRPRTAMPARTAQVSRPAGGKKRSVAWLGLAACLAAWALAATWFAYDGTRTVAQLREQQSELQRTYEDKVRALTRRLVGVASHQLLEQDGLDGRMADLITRQVELENRQAALTALVEQTGSLSVVAGEVGLGASRSAEPVSLQPTGKPRSAEPVEAVPTLRLGAPPTGDTEGGPSSGPARPDILNRSPRASDPASRSRSQLPAREQFARLDASMSRVEGAQLRFLDSLSHMSQGQAVLIRTTLADLGLNPDRLAPAVFKEAMGGPLIPLGNNIKDPFGMRFKRAEWALALLDRLRPVIDAVPLRRPIDGENSLTSNFGPRVDPFTGGAAMHAGMDFRAATGTPVVAAGGGRVITADVTGGYGNLVEIDHGNGTTTRYGHLSQISVHQGQTVTPGTVIGLVGSTGRSTGPHLHYETRVAGSAVDPLRFLRTGAKLFTPRGRPAPTYQIQEADPADLPFD